MSVRWTDEISGQELDHPFADAAWMRAWWGAFGKGTLSVARSEEGALPMTRRHGRLIALSNYHSPIYEPAARTEAAAEELLRAAFTRGQAEVWIHALPERLLPAVRRAAGSGRVHEEPAHSSPIVDTTGDVDAYVKGLGSTLKRRRRKLEREHEVVLRLDDGGDDLAAALVSGFAIEASGWKTENGTAILSRPDTTRFYQNLAAAYRERGELVLGTLSVDGRDVAWHYTLRRGGRLYMLKTGYLEDAGKLAPGLILHLLTIEHCFADPEIEAYELLGDVERWKLEFATGERRHVRVAVTGGGIAGTGMWVARRHGLPLARRARDELQERREQRRAAAARAATLPPAIILGGGPIAVPVARSLAATGVETIALGYVTDPVRHSRACSNFVDVGAHEGVQERWMEWLRGAEPGIVLPCSDDALELVARRRAEIEGLGHKAIEANDEVLLAMLDKHRTYEMAREAGVPSPATALVGPGDDILAAAAHIPFPLGIKPRHAHLWQRHFGLADKVIAIQDAAELERQWARIEPLGLEVLLTEIVPGPDDAYHSYYSFIDEKGTPLAEITKHKIRQYPPNFGLSSFHRIDRNEEAVALGRRLYAAIGLRGLGCVEFKRDERSGEMKIIEVNHRFTLGHEIVRHAGIDYALLAYDRLAGRKTEPFPPYRQGVTMWHPVEDVQTMLIRRAQGTLTPAEWAASLRGAQLHFPLFSWRDPQPSLRSWAARGSALAGRARRR